MNEPRRRRPSDKGRRARPRPRREPEIEAGPRAQDPDRAPRGPYETAYEIAHGYTMERPVIRP